MIGIYKITSPNNRVYIGQSVDIERRWISHRYYKGVGRLYNSFKKHGFENHTFEVLEECDIENLNERERFHQDFYDVLGLKGLNSILTTTEDQSGFLSLETKARISASKVGKKLPKEHRERIGKSGLGRVCSTETREKISKANKGRIFSEEIKRKNSESQKGRIVSEETKEKIRLNGRKGPHSEESKQKMSKARLSRGGHSEETKNKIKLSWIKRRENNLKNKKNGSS